LDRDVGWLRWGHPPLLGEGVVSMTYDFNGTKVKVEPGTLAYVITDDMGSSVSVIKDRNIKRELERGIWVEAYVYQVSEDGVSLISQPGGES